MNAHSFRFLVVHSGMHAVVKQALINLLLGMPRPSLNSQVCAEGISTR